MGPVAQLATRAAVKAVETKLRIEGTEAVLLGDGEGDAAGVGVAALTAAVPPGNTPVLAMPRPASNPAPAIPAPVRNPRRLTLKWGSRSSRSPLPDSVFCSTPSG
ncbi:hypothetical protein GCM10027038_13000 [Arthrobacter bambusae]